MNKAKPNNTQKGMRPRMIKAGQTGLDELATDVDQADHALQRGGKETGRESQQQSEWRRAGGASRKSGSRKKAL